MANRYYFLSIYFVVSYLRIKKSVKLAIKIEYNIYESDTIQVPFIYAIVHPKIYLPINLNEQDKEIVLTHEFVHLRREDYLIN